MKTYIQSEYKNILKDEISFMRFQIILPLLYGIAASFLVLALTVESVPQNKMYVLVVLFISITLGIFGVLWNLYFKHKHKEHRERIEQLKKELE